MVNCGAFGCNNKSDKLHAKEGGHKEPCQPEDKQLRHTWLSAMKRDPPDPNKTGNSFQCGLQKTYSMS